MCVSPCLAGRCAILRARQTTRERTLACILARRAPWQKVPTSGHCTWSISFPKSPQGFDEDVLRRVRAIAGVTRVAVVPSSDASTHLAFSTRYSQVVAAANEAKQGLQEVLDAHNATLGWWQRKVTDFSVVLFRPNFMLASEENLMKAHKNQWLLTLPSPPDLPCGAINQSTHHGVWGANAFAVI